MKDAHDKKKSPKKWFIFVFRLWFLIFSKKLEKKFFATQCQKVTKNFSKMDPATQGFLDDSFENGEEET